MFWQLEQLHKYNVITESIPKKRRMHHEKNNNGVWIVIWQEETIN